MTSSARRNFRRLLVLSCALLTRRIGDAGCFALGKIALIVHAMLPVKSKCLAAIASMIFALFAAFCEGGELVDAKVFFISEPIFAGALNNLVFTQDNIVQLYEKRKKSSFERGLEHVFACCRFETRSSSSFTGAPGWVTATVSNANEVCSCTSVISPIEIGTDRFAWEACCDCRALTNFKPGTYDVNVRVTLPNVSLDVSAYVFQETVTIVDSRFGIAQAFGCEEEERRGSVVIRNDAASPWCMATNGLAMSGSTHRGDKSVLSIKAQAPYFVGFGARTISAKDKMTVYFNYGTSSQVKYMETAQTSAYDAAFIGQDVTMDFVFSHLGDDDSLDELHAGVAELMLYPVVAVSFDANNDGQGNPGTIGVAEGFSYDMLSKYVPSMGWTFPESGPDRPPVSKKGEFYTFAGWYYGNERVVGASILPNGRGSHKLVARWNVLGAKTWTVTYKPGGKGNGDVQTQTKVENVDLTLYGSLYTRTGYEQTGWSLSDGGTKDYELGETYTEDAALTLFPYWEKVPAVDAGPDFVVESISVKPSEITEWESVRVSATVRNAGKKSALPCAVRLKVDGEWKGGSQAVGICLAPGGTWDVSWRFTGSDLGVGSHSVVAVADAYDDVKETNEGNNSSGAAYVIVRPPAPSSAVVDWEYVVPRGLPDALYLTDEVNGTNRISSFRTGETVYVRAAFHNAAGDAVTTSISLRGVVRFDGAPADDEVSSVVWRWASLAAGEIVQIPGAEQEPGVLQGLRPGEYTLVCTIDPENQHQESDESDNVRSVSFVVKDGEAKNESCVVSFASEFVADAGRSIVVIPGQRYDETGLFPREGPMAPKDLGGYFKFKGWVRESDYFEWATLFGVMWYSEYPEFFDGGVMEESGLYFEPLWVTGDSLVPDQDAVTLRAVWDFIETGAEIDFGISYILNGGVNSGGNPLSYRVEDLPIRLAEPSKAGGEFLGWTLNGKTVTQIPRGTVGDIVIKATWKQEDSSDDVSAALGIPGLKWSTADFKRPYSSDVYDLTVDKGWSWDENGSVRTDARVFNSDSFVASAGMCIEISGPTAMRFRYSKSFADGLFKVECNGRFLYMDETPGIRTEWKEVVLDIPEGRQTVWFVISPGMPEANRKNAYNGVWLDDFQFGNIKHETVYLIDYDTNGLENRYRTDSGYRTTLNPLTYTSSDLPIALRDAASFSTGYVFQGWLMNGKVITEIPKGTTGDLIITAKWKSTMSQLTVKPNSTKYGSASGGGTYTSGTKVALKAKEKSGYAFAGWYTDKACTKKLNPKGYDNREPSIKYTMPAKKTTIYAKFLTKAEDKKALKFSAETAKLARTAASYTAGKAMSLKLGIKSATLPTVTAKSLPDGMGIDPVTGAITGKPTVPGKYVATVTVKTAAGNKISQKVKIYVTVPSGYYGTFDGYALVKTTPAYMTFTSDKYGAVSGKVTYKGKGYSFKASYSSASSTQSKFTPSIKIGSMTYKPVTYVEKATGDIAVSEARGEQSGKFVFVAQKKPGLVAKKKALAKLIGQTVKVKYVKGDAAALPKAKDSLTLKFAETDAVKVSGKLKGRSVSFSTTLVYRRAEATETGDVYTAEAALIEPKSGYRRLATFTLTVGAGGKVAKKVSFGKIK